jgi:hypothetical protein
MTRDDVIDLAHTFRVGKIGAASDHLARFVDELGRALPALGDAAAPLFPPLERALAAQARGDYAALADELEHEVAPLLAR